MSSTSFVNHLGGRPPQYRTPSPPRRAVEPISPSSTTDFRALWPDFHASKASSGSHREHPIKDPASGYAAVDGRTHHNRTGHGRSNSTIDTLATIALATSPPFAPLQFTPPSPNSTSAIPLFAPESTDSAEPPAKRPRSDKNPSPFQPRSRMAPDPNPPSFTDSMKTDAELLLNFARPSSLHFAAHSAKLPSVDETYPRYGYEPTRHSNSSAYTALDHQNPAYSLASNGFPSSRMRSQSDGSTITSRPVIRGVRPNTSSSNLPPITGQGESKEDGLSLEANVYTTPAQIKYSLYDAIGPSPAQESTGRPQKVEEDTDTDDSDQTSCAACNLVRIPTNAGEQDEVTWINCDGCKQWFHIVCAGFKNDREIRIVDRFICRKCRPIHGQTTFVRKSSRARTAIDYAGLHQGLVMAATDSLEHHYIEPIRQGRIRFLPDNFPRMHPDLVTAEYFERGIGMTEPIVIPAHLNKQDPDMDALVQEAPTQEMFDELLEHLPESDQPAERLVDCGQDRLDMVIPKGLTVRTVADLYGPEERVEVIDVKSQQGEDKRWNMQKWADYYESTGEKVVRNVISLEISHSKLGRLIRRPKVVLDLDLQDSVWPEELKAIGDFPKVQLYCLMSVADCYTDFHIDFGGSSVFYTILKGRKTFFFIPPKDKYLKKYEEWCNSPAQDSTFLGDQTKECYRVDLYEGDTMLIPSGWIHAVWTPKNSLVIGGNFLTKLNYGMQIKIAKIEKDTKVPRKFRYPFFQKIQWYAALKYLEDDPIPQSVLDCFMQDDKYRFYRDYPVYYEFGERANTAPPGSPYYNSRFYSQAELEGLPDLAKYLLRTALIAGSYIADGVTMEVKNAIRRSIPKGVVDPVDTIRKFGVWVAWKRGNEHAPTWTRPGVIESNPKVTLTEKKPAGRPSRRSERNTSNQKMYAERQAVQRLPDQLTDFSNGLFSGTSSVPSEIGTPAPGRDASVSNGMKQENMPKPRAIYRGSGLGPKRVACDACRRRRIRCRHKDEQNDTTSTDHIAADPYGPGIGVQSQTSLAHDAASALNSLAAIASEAGFQDGAHPMGLDRLDGSGNYNMTVLGTPSAATAKPNDISPDGAHSGKKGRSKACEDCRKSKVCPNVLPCSLYLCNPVTNKIQRRCIHDEYGRIDPVKAQERSKPRATASTKRVRHNDEDRQSPTNKKPKQESTSPTSRPANLYKREEALDPQLVLQSAPASEAHISNAVYLERAGVDNALPQVAVTEEEKAVPLSQTSYASPPTFQTDAVAPKEIDSASVPSQPTATLVSPPTSLADETDVPHEHTNGDTHVSSGEHPTILHTPNSSSRHSSRQPRQVDRYAPEAPVHKASRPALPTSTAHRSSSGKAKGVLGPPSAMKKPSSRPSSSHAKTSNSPITEKKFGRHGNSSTSPGQTGKSVKQDQAHFAEDETDIESLRLVRELHEQEFGLRKRTTRV